MNHMDNFDGFHAKVSLFICPHIYLEVLSCFSFYKVICLVNLTTGLLFSFGCGFLLRYNGFD